MKTQGNKNWRANDIKTATKFRKVVLEHQEHKPKIFALYQDF